jgi:hypothetical protein
LGTGGRSGRRWRHDMSGNKARGAGVRVGKYLGEKGLKRTRGLDKRSDSKSL